MSKAPSRGLLEKLVYLTAGDGCIERSLVEILTQHTYLFTQLWWTFFR